MSNLTQAPPELARLAESVQESTRTTERLERCMDDMQQGGLFTSDELEAVHNAIMANNAAREEQQIRLARALHVWEKDIVGMQRHLSARQAVIERYEEVVGMFPDVMQTLAQTQLTLSGELEDARQSVGISASTEPTESCPMDGKPSGNEPVAGGNVQCSGKPEGGTAEGADLCTGDGQCEGGAAPAARTPE